jgi:predicted membrane protein
MAFCSNCGTELAEGTRFCVNCGTKVEGGTAKAAAQAPVNPAPSGQIPVQRQVYPQQTESAPPAKTAPNKNPLQYGENPQQPVYQEQAAGDKNDLLLAAWIVGICGLVFWMMMFFFVPLTPRWDGTGYESLFSGIIKAAQETAVPNYRAILFFGFIGIIFVTQVTAIILNFLGWAGNSAKKTLASAIFYLFSLTIPSSILCFVAYAKLKKNAVRHRYGENPQQPVYQEQASGDKNVLLLVAWILGICGLVFWIMGFFAQWELNQFLVLFVFSLMTGMDEPEFPEYFFDLYVGFIGIIFVTQVTAIILNFLGRAGNSAKKTLASAILYIFSLTIPSSILCFVAYAKLKKNAVRHRPA